MTDEEITGEGYERVRFRDVTVRHLVVRDTDVRGTLIEGTRLRGAELADVRIDGELRNVVVNGVDIGPLVEAELDRRMPDRAAMRPDDADGFRTAWDILERLWGRTVARARTFPEADLHRSVDGEWSFVQTLRHLNFASASWVGRMVLGDPSPWHEWDLPWDEAPGWEGIPWDREIRPPLDDVLAVRADHQKMVRDVLASLTDDQLAGEVTRTGVGWPPAGTFPVKECLRVVLNEEWEHRLYAERDLTALRKAENTENED
ncbi:MAG TPA: DinB family protein [Pseudonocardiaceae bacterium]|jgi:hypothetical protein|nr:DinB family protein [Pseudonocardiaceae bacterium]